MDQQDPEPAIQATASLTSPPDTITVATSAQPPRACLLGLPKELLNYIIILAVVEDPDADPKALLLKQYHETKGQIRPHWHPQPALAQTCNALRPTVLPIYYGQNAFTFYSAEQALSWLLHKRQSVGTVQRIRVYFEVIRKLDEEPKWKQQALEMYLEDKSNVLAVSLDSPFCVGSCEICRSRLVEEIEKINGRGSSSDNGEERLTALADYFNSEGRVFGFRDGCTVCGDLGDGGGPFGV